MIPVTVGRVGNFVIEITRTISQGDGIWKLWLLTIKYMPVPARTKERGFIVQVVKNPSNWEFKCEF